ncbi:ribosome silencing factor [Congregibacter variabilis]|uniref:Ribosomal silencing factor RsfS n=1 Tax=Congregibacter variabilis TaxID=3081200 RepID=A0ABZ0HZL3_9GAMM|nr:ribosome silencing factor [Congregibacter sp. IMCC43200]
MSAQELMDLVGEALDDLKGVNTVTLDVQELSNVMDYLIICSGTSSRHVKSLADNVSRMAKAAGQMPLGVEGEDAGEWVLVDLGDVVVHVMQPAIRDFYDLERLWASTGSTDAGAGEHVLDNGSD